MATLTRYPQTVTSNNSVGTKSWSGTGNVAANDGSNATATVPDGEGTATTELLKCTNFSPDVPVGATVTAVVVNVHRKNISTQGDCAITDSTVKEVSGGSLVGSNLANGDNWTDETIEYPLGETLVSILNASDYGIALSADISKGFVDDEGIAAIDVVEMVVTYTPAVVPPPPLPGTGGLNTGGAFFAMMIAQQGLQR